MFKGIRDRWDEARADVLMQELQDTSIRLQSADTQFNQDVSTYLLNYFDRFQSRYGRFENLSNQGLKRVAKELKGEAKNDFHLNMAKGYAGAMFSAYVEAKALPGEKAKVIVGFVEGLLGASEQIDNEIQAFSSTDEYNRFVDWNNKMLANLQQSLSDSSSRILVSMINTYPEVKDYMLGLSMGVFESGVSPEAAAEIIKSDGWLSIQEEFPKYYLRAVENEFCEN